MPAKIASTLVTSKLDSATGVVTATLAAKYMLIHKTSEFQWSV
jgi:hypothetical protein